MAPHTTAGSVVTVLFVLAGLSYLLRAATAGGEARVGALLHAAMCAAMAAMPWALYGHLPTAVQLVFFSAAALWFLGRALFATGADPARARRRARLATYHAAMMAAAVWMAVAMSPFAPAAAGAAGTAGAGAMAGMSPAEMAAMPGMPVASGQAAVPILGDRHWASIVAWILGAGFALAGLWFAQRTLRRAAVAERLSGAAGLRLLEGLADAVGAAGMAVALLVLMT